MAEYPVLTLADEVTPATTITVDLVAGATYGPVAYWAMNDPGGTHADAVKMVGSYLKAEAYDGTKWVLSGLPILDERWIRVTVDAVDNAADPTMPLQTTGTTALGAGNSLRLADISKNCGRRLELSVVVPGDADTQTARFRLRLATGQGAVSMPAGFSTAAGHGVLPGYRNISLRRIVSGGTVTASSDDHPVIARRIFDFDGTRGVGLQAAPVANQTAADGALAAGQSYIALLTQKSDGTVTLTKGNKGTPPVAPVSPVNEIALAKYTVAYQAGGTSLIAAADVSSAGLTSGDRSVTAGTGLTAVVSAGDVASSTDTISSSTVATIVALTDAATNRIWILPYGGITATTTAFPPAIGAELIATVTTAGGVVTTIADLRQFAGGAVNEYTRDTSISTVFSTAATPVRLPMIILPEAMKLDSVTIDLDKLDATWTAGAVKFDVLSIAPGVDASTGGTTIYTGNATDDQRPSVAYNAASLRSVALFHEVRRFVKGTRFVAVLVGVPAAPAPESTRLAVLQLHFMAV